VVVVVVVAVVVIVVVVVVVLPIVIYLCETYHCMSTLVLLNIPLMCNLRSSPCQNIL